MQAAREFFGYALGLAFCIAALALCGLAWIGLEDMFGWRWALGAWGVGTYRQDDSIDVRWSRPDGSSAVAQQLEVSEVID